MTRSDFRSYVTVCAVRIWTLAPALGTLPPSQVAGADQRPLWAVRTMAGPAFLSVCSAARIGSGKPQIPASSAIAARDAPVALVKLSLRMMFPLVSLQGSPSLVVAKETQSVAAVAWRVDGAERGR